MNVNSGGPHILLFERDQQLTGLLTSEFQLAGYECHTARTAVEVFDGIARFPIRLVLVNLAQAAANRREFWVALDAQRRGRGVQVFTFRCMNLAGYGPDDPEDRSRAVLTDMEVDGMLGVMNLVDAVRARIPGPVTGTGSISRLSSSSNSTISNASRPESVDRSKGQTNANMRAAQMTGQPTSSLPAVTPAHSGTGGPSLPVNQAETGLSSRPTMPGPTFTDKIRAVIYPGNRSYSPTPEVNWAPHAAPPTPPVSPQPLSRPASYPDATMRPQVNPYAAETGAAAVEKEPGIQRTPGYDAVVPPTPSYQQGVPSATNRTGSVNGEGTGLEQLSRMVRENPPAWVADIASSNIPVMAQSAPASAPLPTREHEAPYKGPQTDQVIIKDVQVEHTAARPEPVVQAQPVEPKSINELDLRPSPIEGLPIEHISEKRAAPPAVQTDQTLAEGIASITSPLPAIRPTAKASVPLTPVVQQTETNEEIRTGDSGQHPARVETEQENPAEQALIKQLSELSPALRGRIEPPATSEEVLLDIVQSLPPMPTLPTVSPRQTPVLSGRATRSLGNVLLEGHLVPQHRLEVAQNIQRMLRGVDLNYQLGEILLMFKLLTPDQLLAASLVSYGLISAPQISGLGRIRQELHMMGLEYDLESLLVLFRILSPDQLREVRASWSS